MDTSSISERQSGAARRLRIAVVSPLFPLSADLSRGLPIYRTVLELKRLADVAVFVPLAVYPRWRWLQPQSYTYHRPDLAFQIDGLPLQYHEYKALPGITRPLNGSRVRACLMETVRRFQPDVILAYWLYPEGYGAYRIARKLGVPFVVGVRGSDLLHLPDPFTKMLVREELANASAVLAVSPRLKRRTLQLGAVEGNVRVQLNGCDPAQFRPSDRVAARLRLGIAEESELVLFVGHLVAVKGLQYLLRAAIQLSASRPNLELVIVGEGSEREALLEMLAASGARLNVRFVGNESPDRVAQWMAACNVFCLSSINEGCPNVVIEAICCGRPVVATDVGANPELVNRRNGALVPPQNAEKLAAALEQVLSREWDSDLISRTFQRGWNVVAKETFDICRGAVSARVNSLA